MLLWLLETKARLLTIPIPPEANYCRGGGLRRLWWKSKVGLGLVAVSLVSDNLNSNVKPAGA